MIFLINVFKALYDRHSGLKELDFRFRFYNVHIYLCTVNANTSFHCLIYIQATDQLEYLIPEKSSLQRHLQCPDSDFVDFLSYLLQINPRKRPTANEALQHPWFSNAY
jgi:serine/threonine protein kinase